MRCLQKPAGSVLYFSSNMLSSGQSSVSLQCSIYSQSLGANGLYPATHLLHFSVVKDGENEVFPNRHRLCSTSVHDPDPKGNVSENVFCDPQAQVWPPSDSVHNWQGHLFPLFFFLVTLESNAAKSHYFEPVYKIKRTIFLLYKFAINISIGVIFLIALGNLEVGKFVQALAYFPLLSLCLA